MQVYGQIVCIANSNEVFLFDLTTGELRELDDEEGTLTWTDLRKAQQAKKAITSAVYTMLDASRTLTSKR